jgi:hypothetical protein
VSSLGKAVGGVARRLPTRPQERRDDYALCTEDDFWFRPAYTDGKCPLCGKVAPGGAPPLPLVRRMGRSWFGVAGLAIESFAMLARVLFMYFRS